MQDADHEESSPGAQTLFISRLACSLVGKTQRIGLVTDSLAHRAYGKEEIEEQFFCNFGLNPTFKDSLNHGNLRVTGIDAEGGARIVEIAGHPFFVATLFLPQIASQAGKPHPLITRYLEAASIS